jgi:hypothetical protein
MALKRSAAAALGEVVESPAAIILAHEILASVGRHPADLCHGSSVGKSRWKNGRCLFDIKS